MQLHIFSVFDEKAEAYITPFFLPTIAMALRTFTDCAIDPEHQFGRHPADYTLYHVGTFDQDTCQVENKVSVLITGLEARASTQDKENNQ